MLKLKGFHFWPFEIKQSYHVNVFNSISNLGSIQDYYFRLSHSSKVLVFFVSPHGNKSSHPRSVSFARETITNELYRLFQVKLR